MKEGDKYVYTDFYGKKWELTYGGTRRDTKGYEFKVFYDEEGTGGYWSIKDKEVSKMVKTFG